MSRESSVLWTSTLAVRLYRLSHACHRNGRAGLARLFWQLNLHLTGADLDPASRVGDGLLIPHPAGVTFAATAGRNLVLHAMVSVGPAPEAVRIGDDVVLEPHVVVRGPSAIGDRARVEAGCIVTADIDADRRITSAPTKAYRVRRAR